MSSGVLTEDWYLEAACRGPSSQWFFPPPAGERRDERDEREALAKAVCAACGVRRDCLDAAIERREAHGIWGGCNEIERRAIQERIAVR